MRWHTEETRRKLSESAKAWWSNPDNREQQRAAVLHRQRQFENLPNTMASISGAQVRKDFQAGIVRRPESFADVCISRSRLQTEGV